MAGRTGWADGARLPPPAPPPLPGLRLSCPTLLPARPARPGLTAPAPALRQRPPPRLRRPLLRLLVDVGLEPVDEVGHGHPTLGPLAPPGIDAHGPRGHVIVADDKDVRDLLQLGPPHPRPERFVGRDRLRPEARCPESGHDRAGIVLVVVSYGEHLHLDRCHPRGEGACVVLDEDGEEPFYRAEQCAVDHEGTVAGIVGADVLHFKALRELEVDLDRRHLPVAPDGVTHMDVDLRSIKSARRPRKLCTRGRKRPAPPGGRRWRGPILRWCRCTCRAG